MHSCWTTWTVADSCVATANTATTGVMRVQNNTGMFVGAANVFNVNTTTTDANIKSNISGGNLIIQSNVSGTHTMWPQHWAPVVHLP
jgi:hypothetical protein